MSIASDIFRNNFKEFDDIRDAGLSTPENIIRYDNILYGSDNEHQLLDVYRPNDMTGKVLPVIVSVHGGGWVYGDKERYQYYCMNLAQRGFAVVNFTYRLAPEYKYPASLEDTNLVFTWVLEHAVEYGFDKEHIFAVGDSAGGHNLGLYVAACTNPEYAKQYSFQIPEGFVPTAIALNSGIYIIDFENKEDILTQIVTEDFLPENGSVKEQNLINVMEHVTTNYPPTFLMTATGDAAKAQAPLLAAKLADCEIQFLYRYYGGNEKELGHVFHLNIRNENAKLCNDEECGFFQMFC